MVGKQWTDTGDHHEKRGLKNRPGRAIRIVPIPGELVAILRAYIAQYGQAPDGRLFRSEHGGSAPSLGLPARLAAGPNAGAVASPGRITARPGARTICATAASHCGSTPVSQRPK